MTIEINEIPIPASRPRISKFRTYYNEPYKSYKELLKEKIIDCIPKVSFPLYEQYKPLKIQIIFYMPIPKSISKKKKMLLNGSQHTKKPDLDNLLKAVLDGMNDIVYYDDAQVFNIFASKFYSDSPRTVIEISSCE